MIVDKIDNLETYKDLSQDIYEGLKFIHTLDPNIELGVYPINEHLLLKVMEYPTVEDFKLGYEAHQKHLDIHYVLRGHERIKWSPINKMVVKTSYDEKEDAIFYEQPIVHGSDVALGDGVFAIMFPQDGHACQYYVEKCEKIKKVVIKVKID